MSYQDNRGIEPEERYYRRVTPLKHNPYEALIDSYINDTPLTIKHPDTIFWNEEVETGSSSTWVITAIHINNKATIDNYLRDGWVYLSSREIYNKAGKKTNNGIVISPLSSHKFLKKYVTTSKTESKQFSEVVGPDNEGGYSPIPNYDQTIPSSEAKGSRSSQVYYNMLNGYTMGFNSTIAFLVPEFHAIDNYLTYALWRKRPDLKSRYVVITPQNNVLPRVIDPFNIEKMALKYNGSCLLALKDNIAFLNDNLEKQIPEPNLNPRSTVTINLASEGQGLFNFNFRVVSNLDDLLPEFNPLTAKFTNIGGEVDDILFGFFSTFFLTRRLLGALRFFRASGNKNLNTDDLPDQDWSNLENYQYQKPLTSAELAEKGGFTMSPYYQARDPGPRSISGMSNIFSGTNSPTYVTPVDILIAKKINPLGWRKILAKKGNRLWYVKMPDGAVHRMISKERPPNAIFG